MQKNENNQINEINNISEKGEKSEKKEKKTAASMVKTAGSLGIITFITVLVLAVSNSLAAPVIEKRFQEEKDESIVNLFGDGIFSEELPGFEDMYSQFNAPVTELLVVKKSGTDIISGYCVIVTPKGFNGRITMLVAINPDATVKDTEILNMSETSGSGTKIDSEDWFQDQFKGKNIEYLPDINSIDVVANATVSSKAFYNGITSAIEIVKKVIAGDETQR